MPSRAHVVVCLFAAFFVGVFAGESCVRITGAESLPLEFTERGNYCVRFDDSVEYSSDSLSVPALRASGGASLRVYFDGNTLRTTPGSRGIVAVGHDTRIVLVDYARMECTRQTAVAQSRALQTQDLARIVVETGASLSSYSTGVAVFDGSVELNNVAISAALIADEPAQEVVGVLVASSENSWMNNVTVQIAQPAAAIVSGRSWGVYVDACIDACNNTQPGEHNWERVSAEAQIGIDLHAFSLARVTDVAVRVANSPTVSRGIVVGATANAAVPGALGARRVAIDMSAVGSSRNANGVMVRTAKHASFEQLRVSGPAPNNGATASGLVHFEPAHVPDAALATYQHQLSLVDVELAPTGSSTVGINILPAHQDSRAQYDIDVASRKAFVEVRGGSIEGECAAGVYMGIGAEGALIDGLNVNGCWWGVRTSAGARGLEYKYAEVSNACVGVLLGGDITIGNNTLLGGDHAVKKNSFVDVETAIIDNAHDSTLTRNAESGEATRDDCEDRPFVADPARRNGQSADKRTTASELAAAEDQLAPRPYRTLRVL